MYPEAGAALGFAVSVVGVMGVLFGVAAGVYVARIGLRRALICGLVAGAALSGLQGLSLPFGLFLALRVLEGASHLALVVAAPTLIAQYSTERHRGAALTLWGTFFGVAFAVLVVLGLPLADLAGVPAVFLAHGAYMALFAVLLWAVLPVEEGARVQAEPLPGARVLLQRSAAIYRSPWIGAAGAGWLFYTFCFVSLLTLMPPFLDPSLRGAVIFAMPLVSILASLTLGIALLRYRPAVDVVVLGFFTSAVLALGLALAPGNAVLCLALAGTLGLVQGASFAAVPQLNPEARDRALANGGMAQTGNIGNTLGVPVLAAAIGGMGHLGLSLPLALALGLGGAVHLWLAAMRR